MPSPSPERLLAHCAARRQAAIVPFTTAEVPEDYLLEKNPATGIKIKVDVEGEKLKMTDF